MVFQSDLYRKQVSLSERGILYNPESDIFVAECLVASFCFDRFTSNVKVVACYSQSLLDVLLDPAARYPGYPGPPQAPAS